MAVCGGRERLSMPDQGRSGTGGARLGRVLLTRCPRRPSAGPERRRSPPDAHGRIGRSSSRGRATCRRRARRPIGMSATAEKGKPGVSRGRKARGLAPVRWLGRQRTPRTVRAMKDHLTPRATANGRRPSHSDEVRRGDAAHGRLTRCRAAMAELCAAHARLQAISRQITDVTDELAAATLASRGQAVSSC